MTMLAAILVQQKTPLIIDEVELPKHLGVGQLLVKVHYSGICGSQLGEIDGVKGTDKYLPHLLGHEGSAEVVAIGEGVSEVQPGDKVVLHWRKGKGIEGKPPIYSWKGREVNAGWVTTFNEYAVVSENRVTPLPKGADLQVAALFGCAITTGFGVVVNNAKLTIGESVVVYGSGGIGLHILQGAALSGAYPIIAIDRIEGRLELAKQCGATHLIHSEKEDLAGAIRRATPLGLDCFIDNTGNPQVIQMGYLATKPKGRVILVGVPNVGNDIVIHSLPLHFGKEIRGSHGGEAEPHIDIPKYYALLQAGRLSFKECVTDIFPLTEINQAIQAMREGRTKGRCLIQMG